MQNKYIELMLKEAQKAYKKNEIPVGCVIVKSDKVIAKSHNLKERTKNCINHAEIIAITKASKKIKNWRLEECELYVTMEPCLMCCGAIIQSRLKKIYFLLENENMGNSKILKKHGIKVEKINIKNDYKKMINSFFQKVRQ